MVDVRPVCFLHTGMGLVYACLLQLSNGIPRVCMSALQLVAPWNSSSVDMLRTISESIVKSAGSGSTSWSMELPNTRIWVHMDMGAREPYGYGCMGPHMDMGAWVLIYGCISHAEDKPFSHADGHAEVDSDSVAHSVPRISRHMHNGPEQHK